MQISDWGNVLICYVREWKHQKYSPWACPFSGVKFQGTFHFQKIMFLQLLQIWSSYCFHCDTDHLWKHTQSNNKTKCFKQILLTVKNPTPICGPFDTKSYIYFYMYIIIWGCTSGGVYVPCIITQMPGESYHRQLGSLLLCSCDVFWALINCFVGWLCTGALGCIPGSTPLLC